jgi:hypothetical protein
MGTVGLRDFLIWALQGLGFRLMISEDSSLRHRKMAQGDAVSACSSLGQVTEAEQQILATAQAPRLQSGEKIPRHRL